AGASRRSRAVPGAGRPVRGTAPVESHFEAGAAAGGGVRAGASDRGRRQTRPQLVDVAASARAVDCCRHAGALARRLVRAALARSVILSCCSELLICLSLALIPC